MTADPITTPAGKRTVVAVLLPREHLPFIRDWCLHHIKQGWEIALYDNTGSVGSTRRTSAFSLNRWHGRNEDKRGNSYGKFTETLTDREVQEALRDELRDLPVTIFEWQPRDREGRIVHGQVEAYVDYITKFRDTVTWTAFIDADEYLQCAPGLDWDDLLHRAAEQECHRVLLDALAYESRWTPSGRPRELQRLKCIGLQTNGCKNIIKLREASRADVHWLWKTTEPDTLIRPDRALYSFHHYRGNGAALDFTPRVNYGPQSHDDSLEVPRPTDSRSK
ncbi:glycosyltransferase family 92 protein [Rhodococcus sp. OK302]|uniref:glycosyltransferase family 92 protein n=1 Tax=Rhodococcus sp. OK302 TaxID=1882769 RepID=UPI000B9460A7|nr:glycosyltransferase family 92 protein [Rhodococcus sp. OK302]OYD66535.1 glycosyl transferase family 92 [Rhodococcus sp. OK302]